ncbi:hypothetical protein DM02DRAFT_630159 [Periconia macrospinosa]|uniref:Uncharacterized protein n=1 Tax=Periconia macrospinosa TaxID=97972 RepID=A0A2V1DKT5_9PLEO|nr:hypothetical protein DM02DRAFT_630159 [Periconia macrospinosa]
MLFTKLALVTAVLSVSQVAAESKCYDDGGSWSNINEAQQKTDSWCEAYGNANYGPGSQIKTCVPYSGGKIMIRMKNGAGTTQWLDKTQCQAMLLYFIYYCAHGGRDDSSPGWRPRADPGEGCD